MKPIRPYKIAVYNRITGDQVNEFYSNQVPQRSDQLSIFAKVRNEADPFDLWGRWVVDQVVWNIAHAASVAAFAVARESEGDMAAAYCEWVDVHVWPAEGPHWTKTPRFAKVLSQDEDEDEEVPS